MVLTHKTNSLKHTNDEIKKTKFEKFKDFVKEKSFLIAVPFVLTFYPMSVTTQETKINYEHEDVEKEVTVNINNNMKKAYSQYKNNKINERDYEIKLFKEVYSQLREDKDFPRVQLSVIVEKMKEELENSVEPQEVKRKVKSKRKTRNVPKVQEEEKQEKSESVLLYEEIETFELQQNLTFEKINNAFEKLIQAYNNKNIDIIEIEEFDMKLHNNEIEVNAALEFLFEQLSFIQEKAEKSIKEFKEKVDSCEVCSDKVGLKFLLDDLEKEHLFVRASYEGSVNRFIHKIDEVEVAEKEKRKETKEVEVTQEEKEQQKKLIEINNKLIEEHYAYIINFEKTKKEKKKPRVILTYDISAGKYANSIPSVSDKGVNTSNLGSVLGLSLITRSGFGFNLVGGYSGEYTDFVNSVNNLRDSKKEAIAFNITDNHLAKMMGGFSYNMENFSISVLGGYKLGNTKGHYPVIGGSIDLTENQFSRLQYEIPLFFKEGQVMNISLEHISQYLFVSSNVNYSKQSSVENTERGNVITNVYPILNTHNIIGGGFLPFEIGTSTFSPILLLAGNYTSMDSNNLQKIGAWSIGPGLGLNVMKNENPIMSLGYAIGIGKYNMKYTDLEGINSFNYNSSYLTHNLFVRINAPLSDKFSIYSDFNFSRGDAKGIEGIRGPIRDYSSFLLFFKYTY
jgi:hypothetical protein